MTSMVLMRRADVHDLLSAIACWQAVHEYLGRNPGPEWRRFLELERKLELVAAQLDRGMDTLGAAH